MNQLLKMIDRVEKRRNKKLEEKQREVEISDDELINKIYKQYKSAWKKLAKL